MSMNPINLTPDPDLDIAAQEGALLAEAVRGYLDRLQWGPATADLSHRVGSSLDATLKLAQWWAEPELAGCLLILALARRQAGGPAVCLQALRHAAAMLRLDLPLAVRSGEERAS